MREQERLQRGGDIEMINRNLPGREIRKASKGCQVEKRVAAKGRWTGVAADKNAGGKAMKGKDA